jgi:hypothetical protein
MMDSEKEKIRMRRVRRVKHFFPALAGKVDIYKVSRELFALPVKFAGYCITSASPRRPDKVRQNIYPASIANNNTNLDVLLFTSEGSSRKVPLILDLPYLYRMQLYHRPCEIDPKISVKHNHHASWMAVRFRS